MILKFKKLRETATLPKYAHEGDSGMDVTAAIAVEIPPRGFALIPTGIAAEIPQCEEWGFQYELQVRPRSGLQCKHGIVGAWGTVDAGYRGDIGVALYNHTDKPYCVCVGDRIAQLVLAKVAIPNVEETATLSETERGANGFGSTGV